MFPAARVGDQTASGDTIVGPGVATVLIVGQPAAVMGDSVKGPTCQQSGSIGIQRIQTRRHIHC